MIENTAHSQVPSSIDLEKLAAKTLERLREKNILIATAESCTGGQIIGTLTEVPGSSSSVDRGFVTYSNDAKTEMLGVPKTLLSRVGAVSKEVAVAMAEGALQRSNASISVSVTGIAGPGGGSKAKPVGTVHIGLAQSGHATHHTHCAFGTLTRSDIRQLTIYKSLSLVLDALK